jgi:hypothetical protein
MHSKYAFVCNQHFFTLQKLPHLTFLLLVLQAMQQVNVIGDRNANWLKAPNQRMEALSNAVRYCPALQALHIAGAYSWVDDHMLAVLGRTCSQLRVLRMDSCEKVTARGLLVSTRC